MKSDCRRNSWSSSTSKQSHQNGRKNTAEEVTRKRGSLFEITEPNGSLVHNIGCPLESAEIKKRIKTGQLLFLASSVCTSLSYCINWIAFSHESTLLTYLSYLFVTLCTIGYFLLTFKNFSLAICRKLLREVNVVVAIICCIANLIIDSIMLEQAGSWWWALVYLLMNIFFFFFWRSRTEK